MSAKKYVNKIVFTIVLLCITTSSLQAQEDFGDDTDDNTPASSIDFYVPLLLVTAVGLGYLLLRQKTKINR
ncbi:hypothetical protein [Flavobacterium sp.]|uniref:hypothetical protein n=1 Tax=Flavobacterium sp. TaxID=239 RepID=UPI002FDE0E39